MNPQAEKARQAVASLAASAEFNERRAMALALVLEHLIQSAGDSERDSEGDPKAVAKAVARAVGKARRRADHLEREYMKIAADADLSKVIRVDLSPGLRERYGVEEK